MINGQDLQDIIRDSIPVISIIAIFTFLSIAAWADARKKEREAFYRSEVRKKLIENWGGENTEQLLKLMQDESKGSEVRQLLSLAQEDKPDDPRRRRERLLLAGLITVAIGGGMLVFLRTMPGAMEVSNIGLIPLFVGLAILAYSLFIGRG